MTTPQDWFTYPTGKIPPGQYCDCCGRYNARHITCTAMVINELQQVLMTKRARDPQAGWWCMPGGYVDWDETVEECVVRELQEEVGLTVQPSQCQLLGVFSDPKRDLDGRQNIDCCFVIKVGSVQISPNTEEVVEWQWFDVHALPENLAFDHGKMIERVKKTPLSRR